ncbi:TRAP transporter small permease [Ferrovum sp. PN-J185]|uniref:TRAP transporter small permease n=1 Tax=Ferrovum sp. PN-J185 TaxID=1356306 RepID=UPI0007913222|nr:TRAP transporter small permease [Ferrovum sp. PN-J185]KXW55313.1 tripartite ATP-independent periplasmic transporters, DctQ component [Ferrovum sp. PN-J185]MCC6068622.1 TRAP transporter small permease [Ferrovum sp. PN-J185]
MSHGHDNPTNPYIPLGFVQHPNIRVLRGLSIGLSWIHRTLSWLSMLALVAACLVLTSSVVLRYFLKIPTDWQDETSIFLLVGAIFISSGAVQGQRGHVAIEAVAGLLSSKVNRIRLWLCDVISLAFISFFTWKSFALLLDAYQQGMTTASVWGPPLWIPYGLMSIGMMLLNLQLLLQVLSGWTKPYGANQ